MLSLAANAFEWGDWAVLATYCCLLLGTGAYFAARAKRNTTDYFLGGR